MFKTTVKKNLFEEHLSFAERFISTKILGVQSLYGTLLEAKGEKLEISSTNLNDFFTTTIPAEKAEGEIIVETKTLIEFLRFLDDGPIEMEEKGGLLIVSQGKTKGTFRTYQRGEYPERVQIQEKGFDFPKEKLQDISNVLFSASRDETRPVLTGVYITSTEKSSIFVTTDGFRLSLQKTDKIKDLPDTIIPVHVLADVIKMMKNDSLRFCRDKEQNMIKLEFGENVLCSRLLDGEFPPYKKVIPDESSVTVKVNRQELLNKVKQVSIFAKAGADIVIFDIRNGELYLMPKGSDGNAEVFVETLSQKGEPLKVAFNYRYILDFLNNSQEKEILIEFNTSTSPGVFRYAKDNGFLHIIMPLRTEETSD